MKRSIFYAICSLLLSCAVDSQVPNYVPTNGLQGYWPFTGNANDISGNNYNGVVNGPVLTLDRFNNANCAYTFNGTSDFIATNYVGILGNNARAVSFWCKTTESVSSMYTVAWGSNALPGGSRFGCAINCAFNGPAIGGAYCNVEYSPNTPVATNNWDHYVFQFNGTMFSQVQIYQNGTLLTQTLSAYNPNTLVNTINVYNVMFGKMDYPPGPSHFKGEIDDIGIWDRVLSNCEIQELYHATKTTASITTSTTNICRGQAITLTASGIHTYTWSNNSNASSIVVSPMATTNYTVSGTNTITGCSATKSISVVVSDCTGFEEYASSNSGVQIYPNPNNGVFWIESKSDTNILVINSLGQTVRNVKLQIENDHKVAISQLEPGVYFVKGKSGINQWCQKIIITH